MGARQSRCLGRERKAGQEPLQACLSGRETGAGLMASGFVKLCLRDFLCKPKLPTSVLCTFFFQLFLLRCKYLALDWLKKCRKPLRRAADSPASRREYIYVSLWLVVLL